MEQMNKLISLAQEAKTPVGGKQGMDNFSRKGSFSYQAKILEAPTSTSITTVWRSLDRLFRMYIERQENIRQNKSNFINDKINHYSLFMI